MMSSTLDSIDDNFLLICLVYEKLFRIMIVFQCISNEKRYITFQFALTKDIYNILNISFIEIPGAKIELRLDQNIFPIFSPYIYSVSALLMHTYF